MTVRNRYLTIVAAAWVPCLALAVGFCLLMVRPQMQRGRELGAKLEETKRQYMVAQAAAKKEDQARLAETVEELRSRVSDFAVELEAAPDLVLEIAKLASDTGVGSFAMRPQSRQGLDTLSGSERLGEKRVEVGFTSRFGGFATFLNALERHRPVLFVESFTISHSRFQSTEPRVTMELALLVERPHGG
ncbi:MAG: hypothetical protein JW993_07420 [Sedimentisphaerales bacterium]|nr:hypothetical protein [Sedimentisphaerales bacterium]